MPGKLGIKPGCKPYKRTSELQIQKSGIAELLQHYSVSDFIQVHQRKYPSQQLLISIPQWMTYFSDADETQAPTSLKGQSREEVQAIISEKVREFLAWHFS